MADRYLKLVNGVPTGTEALVESTGAADAGKIPALNAAGKLAESLMPTGIGADVAVLPASEALAAGDFVNIWNDSGTARCRKADASTSGKEAHGFVKASFSSLANATIYFEGANDQVSGQTPGRVFLSATVPGGATSTPPSTTGQVVQCLGVATGATAINVEFGQHYIV